VGEGLAVESLDPPPASGGPGERGREARGQTGRGFGAHSGRKPDIARSPKSAHVWTAPGWQELFSCFAALVGAAMCSAF